MFCVSQSHVISCKHETHALLTLVSHISTKENLMRKIFNAKNLLRFIFGTFVVSVVFVVIRIISAPTVAPISNVPVRIKSDYVLMLLQCCVGILAMLIPGFLIRRVRLSIPTVMLVVYAVFLYCAIYLGEVRNFYFVVPHWDTILHIFSGAALGALGFSVISILNKTESLHLSLEPAFVALFAFGFAVSLGVIWEIYEFAADSILNTNMQKFALESGEQLVGRAALADTMKDLIVDTLGAFVVSVIGYISLKHEKGWLERFQVESMK